MYYYFRNIAQNSLVRTIFLVLIGLVMWILSLISNTHDGLTLLIAGVLVTINSLLAMQYAYRRGWTNLPSGQLAATLWMALSVFTAFQPSWQIHIVVLELLIAGLIVSRVGVQTQATEQTFLITLMCCIVSPKFVIIGIAVVYLLIALMFRSRVTWRVIMASVIALAVYVLYALIIRYVGWADSLWKENIPTLPIIWWIIGGGIYLITWLLLYLIHSKPSMFNGVLYVIYITLLTALGVGCNSQLLNEYIVALL